MKLTNYIPHYEKFGYKTFIVDNYVFTEPSDNLVILKDEYVLFETNLYKALENTKTTKTNLLNTELFERVTPYSDLTPVKKTVETEQIKEVQEVQEAKKVQETKETKETKKANSAKVEVKK